MRLSAPLRLTSNELVDGHWYPRFVATQMSGHARLGEFKLARMRLKTPVLFPVFNMLTGPATHGLKQTGGIFKFLKRSVLLEDRYECFLSEVLHFSDFGVSPSMLDRWLPRDGSRNIHTWLDEWFQEERRASSRTALFSDSGGFRMLFNTELDLEHYGVRPTARSVLDLQLRYGADLAASLDYPLPPNTSPSDERERSKKSHDNARRMMELLEDVPDQQAPFPFLAVHGQSEESIRGYISTLLGRLHSADHERPFGLAIGSLVPRRSNYEVVVSLVHAAMDEIRQNPWFDPATIPVHVFGITGDMIPVLAYLGVDSFDSSSHIQSARAFGYYDPSTWKPLKFQSLEDLECPCRACDRVRDEGLSFMQDLTNMRGYRTHENPRTGSKLLKSEVYAAIAWHNLLLQINEVEETRRAIHDGDLLEHVVRVGSARPRSQKLLSFLSNVDPAVQRRVSHVPVSLLPSSPAEDVEQAETPAYSLSYGPDDFNVMTRGWIPPEGRSLLLIVPCAAQKPYSSSRSHRLLWAGLEARLGGKALARIQKVSVSGLFGPVPHDLEEVEEVRSYNYYLTSAAHGQIELITTRLAEFLQTYADDYEVVIGYATGKAYKKAIGRAFSRTGYGQLFPTASATGVAEFGRQSNLDEVASVIADALGVERHLLVPAALDL